MGGPSRNAQHTGYSFFCCCVTSDYKPSGLSSHFLWVGVSGHSLAGSPAQGLSKAVTKASARLGSQLKARLGKDPLPNARGCWQDSVPQSLTGLILVDPSAPSPRASPTSTLTASGQTDKEGSRVDYKAEVIPHPFAHVNLSRVHMHVCTRTHMNTHTPRRPSSTHLPREESSLGDDLS